MKRYVVGMKITPAFALAATAAIVHGLASGQQPRAENPTSDAESLVKKIVDAVGGEAAVARVNSTKSVFTRHAKTQYGEATVSVEQIAAYPDRVWMVTKAPQFVNTTVLTPSDSFTIMAGGAVQELPATAWQEGARAIKFGVISVAKHAKDPEYSFSVKGAERTGDLRTAVLEIVVNGEKATWSVDPTTGRVVRATRTTLGAGGAATETTFEYSDWRIVDGISVPFRIAQSGSISAVDDITSWEINPPIPPSLFDRPSAGTGPNETPTRPPTNLSAPADVLPDDQVNLALSGKGRDHWILIQDMGLMAAQGNQVPTITLYMPEAVLAIRAESAKKQFTKYDPPLEDKRRSLMIVAHGFVGETITQGCSSITRVVLLSDPSGSVAKEAYLSEPVAETWRNNFGATNQCQALRTKFSLRDLQTVKAAAPDGEFFVAVFSGTVNTKMYKIKNKHQSKLALK